MLKKRYFLFYFIMPLIIAFLQVAAFDTNWGWCAIFLYSLLFFSVHHSIKCAFWQGYLYGIILFSGHSWGFITFVEINKFAWYYQLLPVLFFLLCSFYSAFWFIALAVCKKNTHKIVKHLLYSVITGIYLWIIHTKSFLIFGLDMGYPLMFPFSIIINNKILTDMFYGVGIVGGSGIILLLNSFLSLILEKKKYKKYGIIVVNAIIILHIASLEKKETFSLTEGKKTQVIHLRAPYDSSNIYNMIQQMCTTMNKRKYEDSTPILFAFPESALPFCFTSKNLKIISENILQDKNINVIFGAFFKKSEHKMYNSCFLLNESRIILHYDKKILLPFWEFIPCVQTPLLSFLFGSFLKGILPFSPGDNDSYKFFYLDNSICLTVLCSELFWDSYSNYNEEVIIMCLLNDSHFIKSLLQKIMFLYARFIAGTQRRRIFYIGHFDGWEIGKNGKVLKKI